MDNGAEKIDDDAVVQQLKRQARKVHIETLVTAGAITAVLFLLPRFR